MRISVVIPTSGRESLIRAIRSALEQDTQASIEVVVVPDGPNAYDEVLKRMFAIDPRVRVVKREAQEGAGACRNAGVEQATGQLIAFLDDDDEWLPGKLDAQMAVFKSCHEGFGDVLVSCRSVQRVEGAEIDSSPVPSKAIEPHESVQDYLFRGRGPHVGRPSLFTSTLVISRDAALRIPWDSSLRRHQDWDWVVRLATHGIHPTFAPHVGVRIFVNSTASISASSDWAASLLWVERAGSQWDRRTQVDFIAGQPLRYALQARNFRGAVAAARAIISRRRVPHLASLAMGAAGIVGRRPLKRMLALSGRSARREFR